MIHRPAWPPACARVLQQLLQRSSLAGMRPARLTRNAARRAAAPSGRSFTASNGYHCMLHYDEEGQELAEPRPAYGANFWAVLGQLLEWGADPNQHQRDPSVYAEHVARAAGVYNWSAARSSKPAESPIK